MLLVALDLELVINSLVCRVSMLIDQRSVTAVFAFPQAILKWKIRA